MELHTLQKEFEDETVGPQLDKYLRNLLRVEAEGDGQDIYQDFLVGPLLRYQQLDYALSNAESLDDFNGLIRRQWNRHRNRAEMVLRTARSREANPAEVGPDEGAQHIASSPARITQELLEVPETASYGFADREAEIDEFARTVMRILLANPEALEILHAKVNGKTDLQIAEATGLSRQTVIVRKRAAMQLIKDGTKKARLAGEEVQLAVIDRVYQLIDREHRGHLEDLT